MTEEKPELKKQLQTVIYLVYKDENILVDMFQFKTKMGLEALIGG